MRPERARSTADRSTPSESRGGGPTRKPSGRRPTLASAQGGVRAETVTAIAATVTAIAALVVAVWDNVQSRRHNRLSVMPQLVIDFEKQTGDRGGTGTLVVRNAGTGPARIESVTIQVAPPGAREARSFDSWIDASEPIRELGLTVTGYADLSTRRVLAADEEIEALRVSADSAEMAGGDPIQDLIDGLAVRIEYASLYDERFTTGMDWE